MDEIEDCDLKKCPILQESPDDKYELVCPFNVVMLKDLIYE